MADYQSNLYKRVRPDDNLGADILMPNKGTSTPSENIFPSQNSVEVNFPGKNRPNKDAFGLVDIFNDYTWTLSPRAARQQVPKIELVEYKLVLSSEISGALYTLLGVEDDVNVIASQTGQITQDVGSAVTTTGATLKKRALSNPVTTSVSNRLNSLTSGKLFENLNTATSKFRESITSVLPKADATSSPEATQNAKTTNFTNESGPRNSELDPYIGLYAIEPTGWVYAMPYLGAGNMVSPSNSWGESTQLKEALGKIMGAFSFTPGKDAAPSTTAPAGAGTTGTGAKIGLNVMDLVKGARDIGLGAGGGLITKEIPKSFTGTDSDSIDVSFVLLNTYSFEDIRRNWEFCFLFTYQNLANRKGINLLDPPSVYRVLIPGYKQLPIGWITRLNIENIGMTRLVDIVNDEPVTGDSVGPNVKMIPEAYKVSFTLQCGLLNARNLFSFAENPTKVVNVRMANPQG